MSTPATPNPSPAGDDRNLVVVDATTAVTFEDKVNLFWKKNRTLVYILCVAIVVAILAKWGYEEMAKGKDLDVQKEYAAATTPEQLKTFAAAHPDHNLGAVAQIRIADDAYKAGKAADAAAAYDKAASIIKTGPLAARAQLGAAVSKVQSGKATEGSAELKKLVDDTNQVKAVRAEAGYYLTSLAIEAGDATQAQKLVDQLMQIDATSSWTQRAMMMKASMPTKPAPAGAAAAPAEAAKKEGAAPALNLNIPAKK